MVRVRVRVRVKVETYIEPLNSRGMETRDKLI